MTDDSAVLDRSNFVDTAKCPVCGNMSKIVLELPTIHPRSKERFNLRQCLVCNHWWIDPMPDQKTLNQLYASDSEFVVSSVARFRLDKPSPLSVIKTASPMLRDMQERESFNYLEIGSASGIFVRLFGAFAKESFGVETIHMDNVTNVVSEISQLPEGLKFDCIYMQDVLEHIAYPLETLKALRAKANSGALLYAGFPRGDSMKARIQKGKWSMMGPVGHLHYFSADSIEIGFRKSGWKVVEKTPVRLGNQTALEVIKNFPYRDKNLIYRLFKSLALGQLILGKDQWKVKASA